MPRSPTSAEARWLLALVLLGVGAALVVSGTRTGGDGHRAPSPVLKGGPSSVGPNVPRTAGSPSPAHTAARPAFLDIPRVGIHTDLLTLGLRPDWTLQVPSMDQAQHAGWYRYSPRPGETGPAVIAGHVDSTTGPAVFYRLSELVAGDLVRVGRDDGSSVRFRVRAVVRVAKDSFPTRRVYGDTTAPELRLITCGGAYDSAHGGYQDNVVVFASVVRTRPALLARDGWHVQAR